MNDAAMNDLEIGDDLEITKTTRQTAGAGTWDVATSPESDVGPGTLRCGYGIWAHAEDMVLGERSDFLEAADVR